MPTPGSKTPEFSGNPNLALSRGALSPVQAAARQHTLRPRRSGLADTTDRRKYHAERHHERVDAIEALTPGQYHRVKDTVFVERRADGTFGLAAGEWFQMPEWMPEACMGNPTALAVAVCLWREHNRKRFTTTGDIVCDTLTQTAIAVRVGRRCRQSIAAAVQFLLDRGVIVRAEHRPGRNLPLAYHFCKEHNGCWTFPLGSKRSTRAKLERVQRRHVRGTAQAVATGHNARAQRKGAVAHVGRVTQAPAPSPAPVAISAGDAGNANAFAAMAAQLAERFGAPSAQLPAMPQASRAPTSPTSAPSYASTFTRTRPDAPPERGELGGLAGRRPQNE